MRKEIYLDNNSSTRVDDKVVKFINKFYTDFYAIASSQFSHTPGIKAKEAIEKAREIIAGKINAKPYELIFTSGATEANNLAIKGVAFAHLHSKRKKVILSKIEHFSVIHSARFLEKIGFNISYVNVDKEGFLDLDHLSSLMDEDTLLVSVIHGNNEVGTIQDIEKISEIVHKYGAYLHTDMAASFLQIPIDLQKTNIDLASISSHKIYGPKGVGALYVKDGTKIEKIIDGGYQEHNLRGGTENVAGIAGFGKAVEIFTQEDVKRSREARNYLFEKIRDSIDEILLNGASDFRKRLPNNLNISFKYIEGESIVLQLDIRGIAVITGSACFSRSLEASHVLLAMGFSHERAHGSIRFSTSKYITKEDIDYTVLMTKEVVDKLRELSPLYAK